MATKSETRRKSPPFDPYSGDPFQTVVDNGRFHIWGVPNDGSFHQEFPQRRIRLPASKPGGKEFGRTFGQRGNLGVLSGFHYHGMILLLDSLDPTTYEINEYDLPGKLLRLLRKDFPGRYRKCEINGTQEQLVYAVRKALALIGDKKGLGTATKKFVEMWEHLRGVELTGDEKAEQYTFLALHNTDWEETPKLEKGWVWVTE